MAAYPTFSQLIGSKLEWVDDVQVDRATGGSVRGRAFYNSMKPTFTLVHRLTSTQLGTMRTFITTNRTVGGISLTWAGDGTSYTGLWIGPGYDEKPSEGFPTMTDVTVKLAQQ